MNIKQPIIFVTGNENKVAWTRRYISFPITHQNIDVTEIQSLDPYEITEHKVKEAYKIIGKPVLVEDTSFTIDAFGKLPGPFIKWFQSEIGIEKICQLVGSTNRNAFAHVVFGYYDGNKVIFGEAKLKGTIADKPRGTNGFGWNPIFIPEGWNKTYAELTDSEMDTINVRRMAILDLEKKLQ